MRGLVVFGALAALSASARAEDITQSCFPGFCIESREAFMVIARQPEKGHFRLRLSRTQSVVYVQAGEAPAFPHCDYWCDVTAFGPEKRATNRRTGQLMGRLVGPLPPCAGRAALSVHLYVYAPEASPARLDVVPDCR